ncbi:MAG: PAS domain S-box protein [Candidatus Marinimicrobia bacterium]|nr:PAS domain S-box protein [Candidatus Neomarinimicrobiota bacterium]
MHESEALEYQHNQQNGVQMAGKHYQTTSVFTNYWEYWKNPDGTIRYISPSCERITGYTSNQFIDTPSLLQEIILPEDKEIWAEHLKKVEEAPGLNGVQFRIQRQGGEIRWIEHTCEPVMDEQGLLLRYHANNWDITKRKQIEEQLLINKRAIDAANDGIIITDSSLPDNPIIYANAAFYSITQYSPRGVIGKNLHILEGVSTDPKIKREIRSAIRKGRYFTCEVLNYRKDGTPFWNEMTLSPVYDTAEKLTHLIMIHKDITKRKQIEEALHRRDEILQAVAFSAERLLHMPDMEQSLQEVIKRLGIVTNVSRVYICKNHTDEFSALLVGRWYEWTAVGVTPRNDSDNFQNFQMVEYEFDRWVNILSQGKSLYGLVREFPQNERQVLESAGVQSILVIPIFVEGKWWGSIGFDVCAVEKEWMEIEIETLKMAANVMGAAIERQWIEDQLRQSHKMEAIGLLAGGIAHDFNNILTAIMGYSHLLMTRIQDNEPLKPYVAEIIDSSTKAANLVQGLLTFSRKQAIRPHPVNLNEIVRKAEILLLQLIDEEIELKTMLADKDLIINADAGQIEQVLINLVVNARDAIPDTGSITIRTGLVNVNEEGVMIKGEKRAEKYALLSVRDTGTGMDYKRKEKIFEPFFTTKKVGKGTGLGLSIVYGIIKQSQGHISIDSELGKGTTFKIFLPITNGDILKLGSMSISDVPQIEVTETILIAEDDAGVGKFLKNVLESAGYTVIVAVDGKDAINKFKANKDIIQLLITDAIMPKKNGKELYDAVKKIKPDMKTIFISGYAGEVIKNKGIDVETVNFIAKPFIPGTLLNTVRKLLDQ